VGGADNVGTPSGSVTDRTDKDRERGKVAKKKLIKTQSAKASRTPPKAATDAVKSSEPKKT